MKHTMKRNHLSKGLGVSAFSAPLLLTNLQLDPKPQLDKTLVQEFVGTSHRDMDKVKMMLEENPTLLNAAHDWGYGDFETALGAASHVGYKELVKYLVDQGAQTDIFTACLFGQMNIVKPMLDTFPKTLHAVGPHGYTSFHHAMQCKEESIEVKAYLKSLGAVETRVSLYMKE